MSEPIKFSKDELKNVEKVQSEYFTIQEELGRLQIAKFRLQQELDSIHKFESDLRDRFVNNQSLDKKTLDKITAKYGDGTLDAKTGVFTPTPPQKA